MANGLIEEEEVEGLAERADSSQTLLLSELKKARWTLELVGNA